MLSTHDLRQQLLAWVQKHAIYVRGETYGPDGRLVSDSEAVEELLDCAQPQLGSLAKLRLADLLPREQAVVETVAYKISILPGYSGSPSDAVTDAVDIVRAAGFVLP